ncbi:ferrous iron transport protein A [Thermococcus sp.]|uniref:FeoA family protein n=1 Tax=Thermococcus sp. TaxID=35749 RepID=UPI00345D9E29
MNMIVPLSSLKPGENGIVVDIKGGHQFRSRVVSMGITPGITVHVVESYAAGPIIFYVGGTRLAMGKGMAARILIKKL